MPVLCRGFRRDRDNNANASWGKMNTVNLLQRIMWDWGGRAFGHSHMLDLKTRALRMVEEAIELAQAAGVNESDLHSLTTQTYARPRGAVAQEIGGVLVTTAVICELIGTTVSEEMEREARRVLNVDLEVFAARNKVKMTAT
jgi:NTP pyrophosphatase (non-canonical NTP hydrolase)